MFRNVLTPDFFGYIQRHGLDFRQFARIIGHPTGCFRNLVQRLPRLAGFSTNFLGKHPDHIDEGFATPRPFDYFLQRGLARIVISIRNDKQNLFISFVMSLHVI